MNKIKKTLLSLALVAASSNASAELIFNISDTGDANANAGFLIAASNLSEIFSDDITINIDAGFSSLGQGILGQANTTKGLVDFNVWKAALSSDISSDNDETMTSYLPSGNDFSVLINGTSDNPNGSGSSQYYLDDDGGANNQKLNISSANAKALGMLGANASGTDVQISFSSDFSFDFDPTDGISSGQIDFVGVAMHEMLHGLGFYSGIDILDYYTMSGPGAGSFTDDTFTYVNGLDFMRHSYESISLGADVDYTADTRSKHFSIDGGVNLLFTNAWSTGSYNGDGQQGSHWKDNQEIGSMDPTAAPAGNAMTFSDLDVMAMDMIGWDLSNQLSGPSTSNVPLPASSLLLSLGFLGLLRKRKEASN